MFVDVNIGLKNPVLFPCLVQYKVQPPPPTAIVSQSLSVLLPIKKVPQVLTQHPVCQAMCPPQHSGAISVRKSPECNWLTEIQTGESGNPFTQ